MDTDDTAGGFSNTGVARAAVMGPDGGFSIAPGGREAGRACCDDAGGTDGVFVVGRSLPVVPGGLMPELGVHVGSSLGLPAPSAMTIDPNDGLARAMRDGDLAVGVDLTGIPAHVMDAPFCAAEGFAIPRELSPSDSVAAVQSAFDALLARRFGRWPERRFDPRGWQSFARARQGRGC